ncbi:MAG: DUF1697 domain-containing protein [Bacteroidetes bacterium]|nr:DUF1697 domain-containing protein [Bacteroidota bacterium]
MATTYISILRGINVSGHRMIKMDALKKMCAKLNFTNIQTYIQSGNIVFCSDINSADMVSNTIKKAIEQTFGFDVPVITLTQSELEVIIKANPFLKDSSKDSVFFHVTLLANKTTKQSIELLKQFDFKNDRYEVIEKTIYLYCPEGYSNSKLTNTFLETKLKTPATTRNWKTINELFKMVND